MNEYQQNSDNRFSGGWFEPTFTERHNANKDKFDEESLREFIVSAKKALK